MRKFGEEEKKAQAKCYDLEIYTLNSEKESDRIEETDMKVCTLLL